MALTQINLDNTSEELIFHIRKKYNLKKPEAINLAIHILSDIFDNEPSKIYELIKTH
jgi:hypothetical protein